MGYDFVVVGAGLTGSTVAERLASLGKTILVIEKRDTVAGNAFDEYDKHGILIHRYGPHIFHTNSKEVFDYLSRFTEWIKYEHKVLAYVDGQYVPIPINRDTLNILYKFDLRTNEAAAEYFEKIRVKGIKADNAESAVVSKVGYELYKKLYEGYTRKMWGTDPEKLSPEITQRIPVRVNTDDRYFTDLYQAVPKDGYTKMVKNMLSNKNISLILNTDYKSLIKKIEYKYIIYTGPIDYFFDYKYGKLSYRSLKFEYKTFDTELNQKVGTINYPDISVPYTRSFEVKHATKQKNAKTTISYEFPDANGEPYYPMLTEESKDLFKKYKTESEKVQNTFFVGRLAEFKYYNMDQAVSTGLRLYKKLVSNE